MRRCDTFRIQRTTAQNKQQFTHSSSSPSQLSQWCGANKSPERRLRKRIAECAALRCFQLNFKWAHRPLTQATGKFNWLSAKCQTSKRSSINRTRCWTSTTTVTSTQPNNRKTNCDNSICEWPRPLADGTAAINQPTNFRSNFA